ncbi:protein Largen [Crotalus adamanteus]|uniref:Protein Largen n=1 Tax=Crotalus adamanteus TaxID=8729 RepID=A0AAW1C118_CROAD
MSAKSKGTTSSSSATSSSLSSPAEGVPPASKAKVKDQIKIIVDDLELVLGDLKDVAKELKEPGPPAALPAARTAPTPGELWPKRRRQRQEWTRMRQTCYTFESCLAA